MCLKCKFNFFRLTSPIALFWVGAEKLPKTTEKSGEVVFEGPLCCFAFLVWRPEGPREIILGSRPHYRIFLIFRHKRDSDSAFSNYNMS